MGWSRGHKAAAVCLSLGLMAAATVFARATRASAATATTGAVYDVTAYGAQGNGTTDTTNAVALAIRAAQANGGGTVFFPPGVYAFTSQLTRPRASVQVKGFVPITLEGAGSGLTSLVEHVANQALLSVRTDGTIVEDLTLDSQSFNGGTAIGVQANNTVVQQTTILGGSNTFAAYYVGPGGAKPTAPSYNTGNQVLDTAINDRFVGDGFSFSFQKDGLIQDITQTGSRLALYVDDGVTVNGDTYTPGAQTNDTNGFWITPPSSDITVNDFVTSGAGGVIGSTNPVTSTNISVTNEVFLAPSGYHLQVGDVNGLTIAGGNFNSANTLVLNPRSVATNLSVQDTTVPAVRFEQPSGASVNIAFTNCTFPALTLSGKPAATFQDTAGGQTTVNISGGSWQNGAGKFFKGTNTVFTVSNLTGYP